MTADASFALHPQLLRDTYHLSTLQLCRVLLMNNALFPWLILVPRMDGAREITDLDASRRYLLMDEIALVCNVAQACFSPDKLNIAALGNQVPQLHVHIIARTKTDAAWPNPVWGGLSEPYADIRAVADRIRCHLP